MKERNAQCIQRKRISLQVRVERTELTVETSNKV